MTGQRSTVGQPVPAFTPHAISVSLPTWRDNVLYEEGDKRVLDAMVTGYPRFFIHRSIQKLAEICERKFGASGELCLLCPSKKVADHCRSFMISRNQNVSVRLVQFMICPEDNESASSPPADSTSIELHIVLFPADAFPVAKQFWQHTGLGISSRLAERCLSLLSTAISPASPPSPTFNRSPNKCGNRHYSVQSQNIITAKPPSGSKNDALEAEHGVYLEERYGRNLPLTSAPFAKRALRRRIADVLIHDEQGDCSGRPCAGLNEAEVGPSSRGVNDVTEDEVFLFPTGMSAIWHAHQLALASRPATKSVCFGFPYTDTLKILEKWGPGCHFFGHGLDSDIGSLEALLESIKSSSPSAPPVLALFCEFPSNPLLRSPNLPRLRALADEYDFLLVVDETIGNFINVDILPLVDIVVSSLTKVFSGDSNVMGGSLVLNPRSRHYTTLKSTLVCSYEDTYFDEDAIFMERNSRNFKQRIHIINQNAEAVCDFLRSRSLSADSTLSSSSLAVVKEVYYPKYTTRTNFDLCRHPSLPVGSSNFGGLFSVTFTTKAISQAFFDALPCYKGPSLGTSFTLACPYTVLAHFGELEWAKGYGVEEGLVRVSVGMEERETLLKMFEGALEAAEAVGREM